MSGAIGGVLGALGSGIGYQEGDTDRFMAGQDLLGITQEYSDLDPTIKAQTVGQSQLGKVNVDPATRDAQMQALSNLQGVYRAGGMDPQARADMATQQAAANQNAQAMNSQAQNAMASRGMGSSGANFAAMRANNQNAANNANLAGLQALAAGQGRSLQALQGSANLAGQVHQQDYGQAAAGAEANDAIAKFNAQNSQNAQEESFKNGLGRAQGMESGLTKQSQGLMDASQKQQELGQGAGQAFGGLIDSFAGGLI